MAPAIEVPMVKKVLYETVWVRGGQRTVTKVHFKGGMVMTFAGALERREATYQAYFQKAQDSGMTPTEAEGFAGSRMGMGKRS